MSDLPARLREAAEMWCEPPELLVEAADALEGLETVQAELLHEMIALKADIDQCPFHGPVAHWDLP